MGSILVAYATGEGQTARIADRLAEQFGAGGHDVTLEPVTEADPPIEPGDFDAVVIGASIHVGKHQAHLLEFVRGHRDALAERPAAFFQVSLSAASTDGDRIAEAEGYIRDFREQTGWEPDLIGNFAGALRYSAYGFFKRLLMRFIARKATGDTDPSRDYEYTDWEDVERFGDAILGRIEATDPVAPVPEPDSDDQVAT
jgi:menaquinone-dependent protoporphyrinogen oxidase